MKEISELYGPMGKRMKSIREAHGHTQMDIATILEVSPLCVFDYENAKRKIPLHRLLIFCKHFDFELSDLINEISEMDHVTSSGHIKLVRQIDKAHILIKSIRQKQQDLGLEISKLQEVFRLVMSRKIIKRNKRK